MTDTIQCTGRPTSLAIYYMLPGVERRKQLLALLAKGYKLRINARWAAWSTRDPDIIKLLKKKKIKQVRITETARTRYSYMVSNT